ncbi:Sedlin [Catenaria anguillulae PL171]|uniref:Sedlin n=1 Tax=Catenaria anguillulae PL171 TaxID=765915 RepID=A0A1Y2H5Q4_9FUNG|nr:Sedlin [Catenaria anguillulae PL171]ORZ30935.1 Sedlin [Catenaria anguillulae PL171]
MPKFPSQIAAVAIVGKLNNPLLVHSFSADREADLKFQFLSHAACDYADAAQSADSNSSSLSTGYLGLLTTLDDLTVYGHQTNTKVKFFLFVQAGTSPSTQAQTKDVEVKAAFELIHQAYLDLLANPFHDPDQVAMVHSPRLLARLQSLVTSSPSSQ